jgi:nucleotide-binding universal stress UspA family protein
VLAELRRPATTQELDALVGRHPVTEAAASIARANHARTAIVAPRDVDVPGAGPAVRVAVEALVAATGEEPVLRADGHPAHRTIPHAAEEYGASLIVMGSRALVLVMRPRATPPA